MDLRNHLQNPPTLLRAGLVFMILGNLGYYFVSPRGAVPEGIGDGIRGLLLGLSIGLLILFLRLRGRQGPVGGAGPCA